MKDDLWKMTYERWNMKDSIRNTKYELSNMKDIGWKIKYEIGNDSEPHFWANFLPEICEFFSKWSLTRLAACRSAEQH